MSAATSPAARAAISSGCSPLNSGDIHIGGDVEGGDGDDVIAIAAFNTNSITIDEDIEGNDDDDLLLLVNLNNQGGARQQLQLRR